MGVSHESRVYWRRQALVWLTILLALRLAALAFNRTELFFDEAQYWSWAQEPAFGYFSKPPLLAWIIAAMTSLCGDAAFCVRAPSPLIYWGAGLLIYFAAEALYSPRTGFWSALVFATLPGVSLSSGLISTDVSLLFCWAGALLAWAKLQQTRDWRWAAALGAAIGVGLNAKYAMAYFLLCAAIHLWRAPEARWLLRDRIILLLALLLPALFILPNLFWNAHNGFITFAHTASNAKWGSAPLHVDKSVLFLLAQFGVFGPVLFAALGRTAWHSLRNRLGEADRMMLFFSVPVVLLIAAQALASRAHANWAAVAYPAATILVTEYLLRRGRHRLFNTSLALHLAIAVLIAAGNWAAPVITFPGKIDPYRHLLGWSEFADAVRARLRQGGYKHILTEDRWVAAELLYYLREEDVTLTAWRPSPHPRDHYQLTRPFTGEIRSPHLLVTLRPSADHVVNRFSKVDVLEPARIPSGPKSHRDVRFFAVAGFRTD